MKCFAPVLLMVSAALLSTCAPLPPPAPMSGQYSGAHESAYRRGYHLGFRDGQRAHEENHERFHREYSATTAKAFHHGYKLGFESGEDQADASDEALKAAKTDGHTAGRNDAATGLSPFHQRHRSDYRQKTESAFREGYLRGFNTERDQNR